MSRPALVVDATVAVKWVLPEPGHLAATCLLDDYQEGKLDLMAPYLLITETGNVLRKRVQRGDLTGVAARQCFQYLLLNSPILLDSPGVNVSALELSLAHGRSVYDCLYLAWAPEQRCDLVTADERFFGAMRPAFPCVRLLGVSD